MQCHYAKLFHKLLQELLKCPGVVTETDAQNGFSKKNTRICSCVLHSLCEFHLQLSWRETQQAMQCSWATVCSRQPHSWRKISLQSHAEREQISALNISVTELQHQGGVRGRRTWQQQEQHKSHKCHQHPTLQSFHFWRGRGRMGVALKEDARKEDFLFSSFFFFSYFLPRTLISPLSNPACVGSSADLNKIYLLHATEILIRIH